MSAFGRAGSGTSGMIRMDITESDTDISFVKAKTIILRDDQNIFSRSNNTNHGSSDPTPIRIKKIFVGGLASTVTESDFKNYFD
ncbi:hypothetical protein RYX36_014244 [Vicia faba]